MAGLGLNAILQDCGVTASSLSILPQLPDMASRNTFHSLASMAVNHVKKLQPFQDQITVGHFTDNSTECRESKECHPAKHHFDECVERVTNAADSEDSKAPKEDCVEECKFCSIPILRCNS